MSSSRSSHRHHRCKSQRGNAHSISPFDIDSMQFDLGDSGGGRRASRSGPLPSTPRMSWGASPMPHQRRGSMGIYMDGLDGIGMGIGVRGLRTGGAGPGMGGGLGFGFAGGMSGIPEVGGMGLGMGGNLGGGMGTGLARGLGGGLGGMGVPLGGMGGGLGEGIPAGRIPRVLRGFGMRSGLGSDLRASLGADFPARPDLSGLGGGAVRSDLPAEFGSHAQPSTQHPLFAQRQHQHPLRPQTGLGTDGLDSPTRLQDARAELLNRGLRSPLAQHPGLARLGMYGLQGIGRARGAYGLHPLSGLNVAAGGIGGRPENYRSPYVEDYEVEQEEELSVEDLLAQAGYGQLPEGYLYGHHELGDLRGGFFL